jgi:hypothetical protein
LIGSIRTLINELIQIIDLINTSKFNSINRFTNELMLISLYRVTFHLRLICSIFGMNFHGGKNLDYGNLSFVFVRFKWNRIVDGLKYHIYVCYFFGKNCNLSNRRVDGCIIFTTFFKTWKNFIHFFFLS